MRDVVVEATLRYVVVVFHGSFRTTCVMRAIHQVSKITWQSSGSSRPPSRAPPFRFACVRARTMACQLPSPSFRFRCDGSVHARARVAPPPPPTFDDADVDA